MENKETIGTKILALRKANGVTQADLGAYLNISYQAVSKWERNESCPDFQTLSLIAKFFNVPITYFEDGETDLETASAFAGASTAAGSVAGEEMLGVCKDCGKVVHKGQEGALTPVLICKSCQNQRDLAEARRKREERAVEQSRFEKAEREKVVKQASIKKARNKGLIWGCIVAGLWLLLTILDLTKVKSNEIGYTILGGGILMALSFTYVSQLFWDGFIVDATLFGGKIVGTPGIIFEFSFDGFIFLIAMKILFALIRLFIYLFTLLISVLFAVLVSPFTFYFALRRVNREGID